MRSSAPAPARPKSLPLLLLLLLLLLAAAATRVAGSDEAALLAFAAGGDPLQHLNGWGGPSGGAPCAGDSWTSLSSGWYGVVCDAAGGRVTGASLSWGYDRGLAGDVAALAPLGELRLLDLSHHRAVHGNVAALAALAELRHLNLLGTSVRGSLSSLVALSQLGATWTAPHSIVYSGGPHLAQSLVHGPVAPLRALPGVGNAWGDEITHFSPCAAYHAACGGHGLALAAGAAVAAGQDECECCEGSPLARDAATGGCTDPLCPGVECGAGGRCYQGVCECHSGFQGPRCATHTGSVDAAALLSFAADGDTQNRTISWTGSPEPCASGSWDDDDSGWVAVMCDQVGGRVTYVSPSGSPRGRPGSLGGNVGELSPLVGLRWLSLSGNKAVHGDIATLSVLTELRFLGLDGTSVHGEVGVLRSCSRLGESWAEPRTGLVRSGALFLKQLGPPAVYGHVAPLRALPGLGAVWGLGQWDVSPCSTYSCTAGGRQLTPIRDPPADEIAGRDECACCTGPTVTQRDTTDGSCPDSKPPPARGSRPADGCMLWLWLPLLGALTFWMH
eukprot:COSAG06_NODE_3392_length_5410_cov_5.742421_4_plen_559_part_00